MPLYSRKKYFILRDFQARFILQFVALATIWAASTVFLFVYLAEKRLERLRFSSHFDITKTSELLLPATLDAHIVSLLVFAALLACTIHFLWKRITPPLDALKRDLAQVAGGKLSREIALREKDEFRELAEGLEGMRKELREKIERLKKEQAVLSALAARFSDSLESIAEGSPASARTAIALFRDSVERMKEAVQVFHYK